MKFHTHNKTLTFANAPAGIRLLNYIKAVRFIIDAASSAIKTTGKKNEGKFNIPGWSSVVKSKHQIAKAAFRLWVNCNRTKTGDIYRNMTKTKKISNIHRGNAAKMLKCIRQMA